MWRSFARGWKILTEMPPTRVKLKASEIFLPFLLILAMINLVGCATTPSGRNPSVPEDRTQMVDAYMREFSSSTFKGTQIESAIQDVLMRLPPDALLKVTDHRRPVLFSEVFDVGTARFAS